MNYLMLVCGIDAPPPPDTEPEGPQEIHDWIDLCGARRIYGEALADPGSARTVRVRDGQVLVSDGPFTEAKEFVAGFDLLTCADLDEAVALAAAHPVARSGLIELRPFWDEVSFDGVGEALLAIESEPGQRFLMMLTADGVPASDEIEAQVRTDSKRWSAELEAAGKMPFGGPLRHADTATTVRVRAGETLLSDGPFVETKEFIAGLSVLNCADLDEAVAHVGRFPLAVHHPVEVRSFMVWDEPEATR
jgi:hypothetical protein